MVPWGPYLFMDNTTNTKPSLSIFNHTLVPVNPDPVEFFFDDAGLLVDLTMLQDSSQQAGCSYSLCVNTFGHVATDVAVSQWPFFCQVHKQVELNSNTPTATFSLFPLYPSTTIFFQVGVPTGGTVLGECSYTLNLQGNMCKCTGGICKFGNNCSRSMVPLPITAATNLTLAPGDEITFSAVGSSDAFAAAALLATAVVSGDKAQMYVQESYPCLIPAPVGNCDGFNDTVQVNGEISLTVSTPRMGAYYVHYFTLVNTQTTTMTVYSVVANVQTCSGSYYGVDCTLKVTAYAPQGSISIAYDPATNKDGYYGSLLIPYSAQGRWSVGISVEGAAVAAPDLYLRLGNIPVLSRQAVPTQTVENFDVKLNTTGNQIRYYISDNVGGLGTTAQQWYFALVTSLPVKVIIFAGQLCPSACSGRGLCVTHRCFCVYPYTQLDCSATLPPAPDNGNALLKWLREYWIVVAVVGFILVVGAGCYLWTCCRQHENEWERLAKQEYLSSDGKKVSRSKNKYDAMTVGAL